MTRRQELTGRQTAPGCPAAEPDTRTRQDGLAGAAVLLYAGLAYLVFLLVTVYAAGFLAGGGFPAGLVPKGIDDGPAWPWPAAVALDAGLLALFAVQHTVMARRGFKRAVTRVIPAGAERATFVLAASLVLALQFWLWRPAAATAWQLTGPAAGAVTGLYLAGWALVAAATFGVSHADLFGLRQALAQARRAPYRPPAFTERGLYRLVRHPLMTGFLVVFWAAPVMTAGHLVFAAASTGYIVAGLWFEERDLVRDLGGAYRGYRARVPALLPVPGRRGPR
jgi:protein-S-isoprenylcysteine O-methyltransferase Ste14